MVDTCVRVEISKNTKCIFQKVSEKPKDNDIAGLVKNLQVMQQQVNDFLTTLVESERVVSDKGSKSGVSDCEAEDEESDDDDDKDRQRNPKKCKFN